MQYTLLFDWMYRLANPSLTVAEALTYSVIYSFSKDGQGTFKGSYRYLSNLTTLSERQQIRVLGKLIKEHLIIKRTIPSGYANEYYCNLNAIPDELKSKINDFKKEGYDKMSHPLTSESLLLNNKKIENKEGYDKMSHPLTSATSVNDKPYDKMSHHINNINKNKNKEQLVNTSFPNQYSAREEDEENSYKQLNIYGI